VTIELDELAGSEGGDESRRLAKYWLDQIDVTQDSAEMKRHLKRGDQIIKRYRDERERTSNEDGQRRYSSLWCNVQILQPALYGKEPLPVAERRFKDKDVVGRNAASILERALRNEIEICGYDKAMKRVVLDYLLVGQGVPWVRYEPQIAEGVSLPVETETDMKDSQGQIISSGNDSDATHTDPSGADSIPESRTAGGRTRVQLPEDQEPDDQKQEEEQKLEDTGDRVVRESTPVDYVPWKDFITFPMRARTWEEVTAIGKRCYLSRQQAIKRFGPKIGKALPLRKDKRGDKTTHNTDMAPADQDKCEVFEIWNKEDLTAYWVAQGYEFLCDRKDDPLNLEKFFPTPEPIFANPTNTTLIPVPDYIQYEDQAVQIDELTQRIAMLTKAAKITGVYNAAAKDIQRMFQESVENELIPVDDWAAFAEEGGVAGNISFLPIKDITGLINELVMVREKLIEDMDRLTGINDIMRGTSDARETLGGVRLKSNNTGTRLTARQNDVARLARDTICIMADIMCQHFSPQSLIEASGALYEEGLGPDDMPDLSAMQPPAPQALPIGGQGGGQLGFKPPMPGAPPAPMGLPPPAMGHNGPPAGPLPGAAPQQPSNVVPFTGQPRPAMPGMPPPAPPMPGAPPQMPGQMPALPGQPPVPPEMMAKMVAIQRILKAIGLLRDERLRGFRVDIEVDSTIFPDQAQDKQDRVEFVASTTKFMSEAAQLGAALPESIPLLVKLLQFGARAYRIGRELEMAIEQFGDEMVGKAKQLAQQQANKPNPEQIKAQIMQQKGQTDLAVGKIRAQADAAKAQSSIKETQMQDQANQQEQQAETQRTLIEGQQQQQESAAQIRLKEMEVQMRNMEMQIEKMRMMFEAKKMHEEAMQPPEVPKPAAVPAA
jgi:hypothetical protein